MDIGRESLRRRYADLNDAELLRRLHSVELTELAREVLLEELQARGVSTEPAPVEQPPAAAPGSTHYSVAGSQAGLPLVAQDDPIEMQDSGAELAADRFAENVYQAPRARHVLRADRTNERSPLLQVAWWIYIGLLAGSVAISLVYFLVTDADDQQLIELAPSVAAGVGLVGWRLRKPLLHPLLWVACLALILAQLGAALMQYPELLREWPNDQLLLLVSSAFGVLFELPVIWGLTRYAFLSGPIWRHAVAA